MHRASLGAFKIGSVDALARFDCTLDARFLMGGVTAIVCENAKDASLNPS